MILTFIDMRYTAIIHILIHTIMVDLHCHSFFSDGLLSPEALLAKAMAAYVSMLALTDNDTTDGLIDLHQAARGQSIRIINGIEFSARWKLHDIHIIGLNINPEHEMIQNAIKLQEVSRMKRAQAIGDCFVRLGLPNIYQKACDFAGHQRIGRSHYADALVESGVVIDRKQAFKRFLARGKSAYIPTEWLSLADVVHVIDKAGGQPVVAHPLKYKLTRTKLQALISAFKEAGGSGIEVVSGLMTADEIQYTADLCHRFELLASSGSDYHGDSISRIGLGQQSELPRQCKPIWQQWACH